MISNAFSWPIVDKSAVKFIRYRHMATQVAPETGGNFDDLFEVTNVRSETDRKLLRTWKVVGLIPDIPRPAQVLHGDQGAAKSRIAKQTAGFDRSITDAACRQRFQDYSARRNKWFRRTTCLGCKVRVFHKKWGLYFGQA